MKTQLELAREGIITPQMQQVASDEDIQAEEIRVRTRRSSVSVPD
jgi:phosphomethylpyrimidine synthase